MLMMHQPLIGWDFTTYLPAALVPYILLLVCNAFNRVASLFTRSDSMEFEDDFETQSGAAARGMQLLQMELENFNAGRPLGLTISTQGMPGNVPSRKPGGKEVVICNFSILPLGLTDMLVRAMAT